MRYLVYQNGRQVDSYYSSERAKRLARTLLSQGDQVAIVDRYGSENGRAIKMEID